MTKRILTTVTNVGHYDDPTHPTGLWLSELTHAWQVFEEHGFEQTLVSPQGGHVPLEPRSLKFPNYDKTAKQWRADPARMTLLDDTLRPDEIDSADYDAIYIVASVCHGYCGLLNTTLCDGELLVAGHKLTGFAWQEEVLARVNKLVPYNAEEEMKERGALYEKALLPFGSYAVTDGNLITGQNLDAAKETAEKVAAALA